MEITKSLPFRCEKLNKFTAESNQLVALGGVVILSHTTFVVSKCALVDILYKPSSERKVAREA